MKKQFQIGVHWILLILFIGIIWIGIGTTVKANSHYNWHGLDFDEARNPANVNQLKNVIDGIAKHNGNYLKLHFSDDQNFAVENQTVGQTTDQYPNKRNGLYYNSKTKKLFMSKDQLIELIQYGLQKNVTIIPEIDVPAHTEGLHNLLKNSNSSLDNTVYNSKLNQLNFNLKDTQTLVKNIFAEYLPLLPNNTPIGTGGDELIASGTTAEKQLLKFDNQLNQDLGGHQMWMYNDSARKKTYKKLNRNIVIEYWSQSEDKANSETTKANLAQNATASALLKDNHKVINVHSYFLYLLAEKNFVTKNNFEYYKKDINKYWYENIFNEKKYNQKVKKSKNIIGSASSIWFDPQPEMSAETSIKKLMPWVNAFLDRVHNKKLYLN